MAFRTTKKRPGNFSATAPRRTSSTCSNQSAGPQEYRFFCRVESGKCNALPNSLFATNPANFVRRCWWLPRADSRSPRWVQRRWRSEEHTSELQSQSNLVCRLLLEKKKKEHTSCALEFMTRERDIV